MPQRQNVCHFDTQWVTTGFKIGYQRNAGCLQQARSNMILAMLHKTVVDKYLRQEEDAGRIAMAGLVGEFQIHLSPIRVILKKGKENAWRLIMDLSSPAKLAVSAVPIVLANWIKLLTSSRLCADPGCSVHDPDEWSRVQRVANLVPTLNGFSHPKIALQINARVHSGT